LQIIWKAGAFLLTATKAGAIRRTTSEQGIIHYSEQGYDNAGLDVYGK